MLESLEVLNGELTPSFDKNNLTYTVQVGSDVFHLELQYKVNETSTVNIFGNENFLEGENKVTIEVKDNSENINTYTLIVMKENIKTTSFINTEKIAIETPKELPNYVAPLISICCFILILIAYAIIFHKKKHKN